MGISIKLRITISFLLLVFLFLINGFFTILTLHRNKELSRHISNVVDPSLQKLNDFEKFLIQSKMYSTNWVFLRSNQHDKNALLAIHQTGYGKLKSQLSVLSGNWKNKALRRKLEKLFIEFESLLEIQQRIMRTLKKFEDYDDPVLKLSAEKIVEDEILPRTAHLSQDLNSIMSTQQSVRALEQLHLERSAQNLRLCIAILSFGIIIIGLVLSRYFTKTIINPINQIRHIINDLGKGITRKVDSKSRDNEIGMMVYSVNHLSEKLQNTAAFAHQIGLRNFTLPFQPLSEEDTLGKALVSMRDNLKSVDERLNEAQHIANLGSWECDLANETIFWSDEMYNIFQQDRSTFIPSFNSILELVCVEDRECIRRHIKQSLKDHQSYAFECRITNADGWNKIIAVQGKIRKYKGHAAKMFGIVQDITDRKRTEAVLEIKNVELQQKNKELEQFAYVASHDLQEPLRTISSFAELFQQKYGNSLDANADKYLEFVVQASDRMKVLIKDLLDYSRIGVKKELAVVDCNLLLHEVLQDLNTVIKETGAEIKSDKLPHINGYPTETKQLFQNLIINAIKFRKKNTIPRVNIKVKENTGSWEFCVEDNGIGIEEEHSERIFIIFQRLHTRSEYEGSGIGLSHCKKIVELHGGKIWIKSALGEGTAFHFTYHKNYN